MARPRKPKAIALVEGRDLTHPTRYNGRNDPSAATLGPPPRWLTAEQAEAWRDFDSEMPWLRESHRAFMGIASILRARLAAGGDVGVQAMNLLRLCLGQMGATPADFAKIGWSPDTDSPDEDIFDRW
ncbi:hypothetical protein SAMN05428967_2259 [Phyllobacterium sp. YR620]|nr:hypothetical protein SAMN05428967_2259 [Phyllobacterium sp. YR620]